jgi:hypothetical protein
MSSPPTVEELLGRNKCFNHFPLLFQFANQHRIYSQIHPSQLFISERQTLGIPSPKTMIITCMDARVIPEKFMGLEYGGEALLIISIFRDGKILLFSLNVLLSMKTIFER